MVILITSQHKDHYQQEAEDCQKHLKFGDTLLTQWPVTDKL